MLLSAMDRLHWPQDIVIKPMEEILPNTTNSTSNNNNNNLSKPSSSSSSFERRLVRPQKATSAAVNCPRCDSTNTKFCYYNNYSLSQPRYFCKTCRRYWTEGGTLRNIPVGGGSRKNKRSSSSSSTSSSSSYSLGSNKISDQLVVPSASPAVLSQNPRIPHDQYGQDLNLGFPSTTNFNFDATRNLNSSAFELLTGITANSFMPVSVSDPSLVYASPGQLMIPLPEFKIPEVSSLDHESNSGRLLFPFEELKSVTTKNDDDYDDTDGGQSKDQNGDSNGFWNGIMSGSYNSFN